MLKEISLAGKTALITGVTGQELVAAEQASRPALLPGDANERDLARAKNLRAVAKIILSE